MSVFRRFSNIVQQKSNAALDKMEDPSQAIDLSYQQLLEQQQKLRTALVEATTGQKRVENQAKTMDTRIASLNDAAQKAVSAGKDDLATQALTQAEVLQQQRQALDPQIETLRARSRSCRWRSRSTRPRCSRSPPSGSRSRRHTRRPRRPARRGHPGRHR